VEQIIATGKGDAAKSNCKVCSMLKPIEIKGLYYAEAHVFEDVDAEFCEGEKIVIIETPGSGNSQLLKLLLGIEKPHMGKVFLFGKDAGILDSSEINILRRGIGVVFENTALISNLKVIENVMLPLQYHTNISPDTIMKRAAMILESVGYTGDMWELPGPLPFYTKKIIAFARGIALDPDIMIYDRLLEGLDSYQGLEMLRMANGFHKAKKNRLTIMIVNDARDVQSITPDRTLRIVNRRFI
jgi:ABC-type transporter Mla maintaining outer membrane lipid asymmetry ATPase subunit MlaF